MKSYMYKKINEWFADGLYWIERKDDDALDTILENLYSLTLFIDPNSAFYDYIMRKCCELEIAAQRPCYYRGYFMRDFYCGT